MTKFYLLGGEDFIKRTMEETYKKALRDSGERPVILYFFRTSVVENLKYRMIAMDYFKDMGGREVIFAELTDSIQELKDKINLSDLIYLPGGDTPVLVERLRSSGEVPLLKRYCGVMLGNSAGSIAVSRKYAVIKDQVGIPVTRLVPGIGLVDFAVSVHYESSDRDYSGQEPDRELRALSRNVFTSIYAIPEDDVLVYQDDNFLFVGRVCRFYGGRKSKCHN